MLQFITHQTPRFGIIEGAVAALNGGCKWIQLRMKDAPIEAVRQTAQQLIPLCKEHEAILVLDDYAQLAADLDIDGVHLGKLDMPVSEARLLIGEKYIIGGTANTFEDIQGLVRQDADYIGLGPFRYTETKKEPESYPRPRRLCPNHGTMPDERLENSGGRHRRYHSRRYSGHHGNQSVGNRFIGNYLASRRS